MKACLNENELMQLWAAEPAEDADLRAHLAQCSRCTASYAQLAREAGTITDALTTVADHLKWRDRAGTRGAYARLGDHIRTALIFSGAAAFGGAAAVALMVSLGWHRAGASAQPTSAAANTVVASNAGNSAASTIPTRGDAEPGTSLMNAGSLYTVDAITSDPLAGLADGGTAQVGNPNAGEDLLFCAPDDDGTICDSSAQQG